MDDKRGDLPSRHAGQGAVRHCPTGIAATAACGSRMRCNSRPRSPSRKAFSTSSSKAMQKDDETFVKLPNAIPVRLLYQTAFWDGSQRPVPPRRLRLGRQCRQGARSRAGPAARRSSSRRAATTSGRKRKLRAPDRAGALIPLPTTRTAAAASAAAHLRHVALVDQRR